MPTIIDRLASQHYAITSTEDVSQLAAMVVSGNEANGTYLKVLVKACQAEVGTPRGRARAVPVPIEAALAVLERVDERFYPAVLDGVGPKDLEKPERHRRATFARSATSELRSTLKAGVDLRALDANAITKAALRRLRKPPDTGQAASMDEASDAVRKALKTAQRAQRMLVNAVRALDELDPQVAADVVTAAVEALEEVVPADPEAHGATTTVTTKAGRPASYAGVAGAMIHRGA